MEEQTTQTPEPQQPVQSQVPQQPAGDDQDIQENKLIAALSYLGILVLVPLLAKRESKFAQFHAKQGIVMLIIFVVGWVIFWIPVIGWALWIAAIVLDVIGLVQALSGKYWEMPVIGGLAKKIKI